MVIDFYTHVFPKAAFDWVMKHANLGGMEKYVARMPQLQDMDLRFRVMDRFGQYRQVISFVSPPIENMAGAEVGCEIARVANESMAELVARHPDRFPKFAASLCLLDVEASLAELDRAIRDLGAAGIQIYTDVGGRCIDHEDYRPIFAAAAQLGACVWIHPGRTAQTADFADEEESLHDLWQILGWPYVTSVTMMRLVAKGLFEHHPEIKVITHHLGGIAPYHARRVAIGLERISRQMEFDERPAELDFMKRPGIDQMRMFYGDTALMGAVAPLTCGIDFFGINNVLFGSDAPFANIRNELDAIDRLDLAPADRERILAGNAERLLGIEPSR
jgi:aminocarboxymuconate-semialdehyde decarboxylase